MKVGRFEEVVTPGLWRNGEVWFQRTGMDGFMVASTPEDAPNWSGAIVLVDEKTNTVTRLGYDWEDAVKRLVDMLGTEEELKKAAEKLLEVLEE